MAYKNRVRYLIAAGLAALPGWAVAAECPAGFPAKPLNFLVGFGPGGGTDLIARSIASAIEQKNGWKIIIENKPGAGGGTLAMGLKTASPDGYAVGVAATDSVALVPFTNPDTRFSYSDFDYPASAMQIAFGLVASADRPFGTLEEFIAYTRSRGRSTISTSGIGHDLIVRKIAEHFGVNIVPIAGSGAAEAMRDALGGHVDATLQGTLHVEQIKTGKMRQLASAIDRRVDYAPDSKTLRESGVNVTVNSHTIFMMPKGVPKPIKTCLEQVLDEAVKSPIYAGLMVKLQNQALNLGPDGTYRLIERVWAEYKEFLKK